MKMNVVDRISFDSKSLRMTDDGYLVATPRVARTGIQLYRGSELGVKDKAVVRVYRPEEEVFSADAMQSLAYRPLTNDHPPVPVTADNWKEYSVGQSGGEVVRDGEYIRVPMAFMDAKAISDVKAGKKQLSVGYSCDVQFVDGVTPDGQPYDAIQTSIRGNHIALVKAARGGDRLSVGDTERLPPAAVAIDSSAYATAAKMIIDGKFEPDSSKTVDGGTSFIAPGYAMGDGDRVYVSCLVASKQEATDSGDEAVVSAIDSLLKLIDENGKQEDLMPKTIVVDGVSVEFTTDQSAQIVQRALDNAAATLKQVQDKAATDLKAANDKATADAASITKLTTDNQNLTAQVATLTKQVEDSVMTPAKLDKLVADRAVVSGKARALLGDKLVVDGKTDAEIRRQVVDAKIGENAKGWNDEQIAISFETLTAGVKPTDSTAVIDAREAFASPGFHAQDGGQNSKREAALNKRDAALQDAWRGSAAN